MLMRSIAAAAVASTVIVTGVQAATFETIWNFSCAANDGCLPVHTTVLPGNGGVLYGTTQYGGRGWGVVFSLTPPAEGETVWTKRILKRFTNGRDGGTPHGGVAQASDGKLYATAAGGGEFGGGVVIELTPPLPGETGWGERVLHDFCASPGCSDGSNPYGSLIIDKTGAAGQQGALYGVTQFGGADNLGVVFQLKPPASAGGPWVYERLYSFCRRRDCADGRQPVATLVMDAQGALYGTTQYGGGEDAGVVFRLAPPASAGDPWVYTRIHSFCSKGDCRDGKLPMGGLVLDAAGKLYGATLASHADDRSEWGGLVYQLAPPASPGGAWTHTKVHSFCPAGWPPGCVDGAAPTGGLALDKNGNLYGVNLTGSGGGAGILFQLKPRDGGGWRLRVLHRFCWYYNESCDAAYAMSGLVADQDGNLYGTSIAGGDFRSGTVFKLTR